MKRYKMLLAGLLCCFFIGYFALIAVYYECWWLWIYVIPEILIVVGALCFILFSLFKRKN